MKSNWYKLAQSRQFRYHRFFYTIKKHERLHYGETKKTDLYWKKQLNDTTTTGFTDRAIYTISDVQRAIDEDLSVNHQDISIIRKRWVDMNNEQYWVEFNPSKVGQTQDIFYYIYKHVVPA